MWSNDHPGALGLETLAVFAEAAPELDLGVAVMALDRHTPDDIAAHIERLGLDRERLWLGVGAGLLASKPLTTMREALGELREALPGVRLVLAAMGPKMCALAGAEYDGAFFNWMTPEFAAGARRNVEAGAERGGPRDAAGLRLRADRGRRRRRATAGQGGVASTATSTTATETTSTDSASPRARSASRRADRDAAQAALAGYEALDVVVVRGLASATVEAMTALAADSRRR